MKIWQHRLRNFSKPAEIWNITVFVCAMLQMRQKPKSGYILAGVKFVKMAGFRPELEPKSGTARHSI